MNNFLYVTENYNFILQNVSLVLLFRAAVCLCMNKDLCYFYFDDILTILIGNYTTHEDTYILE